MQSRTTQARDTWPRLMARRGPVAAAELAAELGVSISTLHRLLDEERERVVSAGRARRVRHALRRPLRGQLVELPLFEIDTAGRAEQVSTLVPVHPEGCLMPLDPARWPVPDESRDGGWEGLPYPMHDMRPQGYMGRQWARAWGARLRVDEDPNAWCDDDVLVVLSQTGCDVPGNLVLGVPAYEQWLQRKLRPDPVLPGRQLGRAYAELADRAVAAGVMGSSAAGEHPKFGAQRDLPGMRTPHVLVKFSGGGGSAAERRWADLLTCEHLALQALSELDGLQAAHSRVLAHAGRTFLDVERFDRHGLDGRSPLLSLAVLDAALVGSASTDWTVVARRLSEAHLLEPQAVARIDRLWWFGRLIANTDMHAGNLSFTPGPRLALAPVYDMLPMRYAPLPGGEVPPREVDVPLPLPHQRSAWKEACTAALRFWQHAAADTRLDEAMRAICTAHARQLADVADRV